MVIFRPKPIVSEPLPKNKVVNQPGQANAERIAELESELSLLRQSDEPAQPVLKKPSSEAKRAFEQNIADLIRGDRPAKEFSTKPREATPSRIAAGSFLDKAIRGAAQLSYNPPPSEPSDGSSSSSSDEASSPNADAPSNAGRRSSTSVRQTPSSSRSRRNNRMLLKPIPPTKYTGDPNANAFHRFVREGSAYVKMGRVPPPAPSTCPAICQLGF
jgi:hypothetical protein